MYKNADEQLDRVKLLSELSNQPKSYIIKLLKGHGIKVENESKRARNKKKTAKFLGLYEKGLSDMKIALEVGVSASTIFNWRKANNLPRNKKSRSVGTETT